MVNRKLIKRAAQRAVGRMWANSFWESHKKPLRSVMGGFLPGFYKTPNGKREHRVPDRFSPGSTPTRRTNRFRPNRPIPVQRKRKIGKKPRLLEEAKLKVVRKVFDDLVNGISLRVAERLAGERVGVTPRTINHWVEMFRRTGNLSMDTSNMGRPREASTPEVEAGLEDLIDEYDGKLTQQDMVELLRTRGIGPVSQSTVQRLLKDMDYVPKAPPKIPILGPGTIQKRINFWQTHVVRTVYLSVEGTNR